MKKILLSCVCLLAGIAAHAQTTAPPANAAEIARLREQVANLQVLLNRERAENQNATPSAAMQQELENTKQALGRAETRVQELETTFQSLQTRYPIVVTGISFANWSGSKMLDNYGDELHSDRMRYLLPVVHYKGVVNQTTNLTIYTKLILPNGTTQFGDASPKPYTASYPVSVYHGEGNHLSLGAWGNADTSIYPPGSYSFEVWYNGACLGQAQAFIK